MLTVPEYNINAKQREFAGHTGRVFDVDLAEDGLCVTASEDGTAKVWRLADGRLEGQLAQSESKDEVLRVAWAPRVVGKPPAPRSWPSPARTASAICGAATTGRPSPKYSGSTTAATRSTAAPGRPAATPTGPGY